MTVKQLRMEMSRGLFNLLERLRELTSERSVDVLIEFPSRPEAIDLEAERRFTAGILKEAANCRSGIAINPDTVRLESVPTHQLQTVFAQASELGALQCSLLG